MSWHCTIRPTKFTFRIRRDLFDFQGQYRELPECCCLQDGLKALALEGVDPKLVISASYLGPDGWRLFCQDELNEVRAIALEEAGCS